jgi:glucose-1-phosphate adenylyltransferase
VVDSIVMDDVTIGRYAQLKRCIVDKNVIIPEGMKIGYDVDRDRQLFKVSREGIVVVPKGMDLSPEG